MGTCYSSSRLETTIKTKRPYDKSFIQNEQSNSQKPTLTSCHQLITPGYLATISNNQLITINNQTNELQPKNSYLDANRSTSLYISRETNQRARMYETKNASGNSAGATKIISKLPKFNLSGRQQVHDVSQVNATKISHFGAKKTTALNADLLRLKGGLGTNGKQQSKSSNSSLTNSETSCGSSLSTNSTASYSNVNRKSSQRKLTFTKSSAASSSASLNERPRTGKQASGRVISKQPTTSNDRLNNIGTKSAIYPVADQFSQALTKLPATSRFTTTLTSIPRAQPQIAQRVTSSIQRPAALPNNANRIPSSGLYQTGSLDANQKCLRPYTLKNTSLSNDNYQPYKKPYTRAGHGGQDVKLGSALRYPYSESNLKSKLTFAHHHSNSNEASQAYYHKAQLASNKKLNSYSGLPLPNGSFRSSKSELRDGLHHQSSSRNNSNSSLNNHHSHSSTNHHCHSNDRLHQLNPPHHHFDQSNHQSQLNEATTRSLTLENENLASEKENKRLSNSFESSTLSKDLSERISQVKAQSKLLNHQNFNNSLNRQKDAHTQATIANLQNLVIKKQLISNRCKQAPNSIETTEDSNSMNEKSISCTNSQKSNSPNSSLTPDISSTSKISPEHNRSDFLIDDEICDQPGLMFLNSKDNSTSTSPVKENVNLVDGLASNANENSQYKTNIRYSITELDSLKLKQELLNQQNFEKKTNDSASVMSSSPEKGLSISQSPVKQFRKPRPLSVVESVDGNLALDGSSFRSVMQDINGIKTLLFRLQGELQEVSARRFAFICLSNCFI